MTDIKIDSLLLPASPAFQVGFLQMHEDSLYYGDKFESTVQAFNLQGEASLPVLGFGGGPKEIKGLSELAFAPNRRYTYNKQNWWLAVFDANYRHVRKVLLNLADPNTPSGDIANAPQPTMVGIYELDQSPQITAIDDNRILAQITTEHRLYNAYTSRGWYDNCYVFAIINTATANVEKLLINRPEVYEEYEFIPNLVDVWHHYLPEEELLYVSYQASPEVYVYNLQGEVVEVFGEPGKGMQTNYEQTNTLDAAYDDSWKKALTYYGFYEDIFVEPESETVFRTYRTGAPSAGVLLPELNPKRMQVYRQQEIIADVSVPSRFSIIGYKDGIYYADGNLDEQNEQIWVYRFEL